MTELQEAVAWLAASQPGLKLAYSDATLEVAQERNGATYVVRKVTVILTGPTYDVKGAGPTILDAVKSAVGAK